MYQSQHSRTRSLVAAQATLDIKLQQELQGDKEKKDSMENAHLIVARSDTTCLPPRITRMRSQAVPVIAVIRGTMLAVLAYLLTSVVKLVSGVFR